MNDKKQLGKAMLAKALDLGLADARVIRLRRHPAVEFSIAGKRYLHVFPGTASDWRSRANAVSGLKRRVRSLRA